MRRLNCDAPDGQVAYGGGMSADAARAAEILSLLSSPLRLRAFAALAERIPHGCSLTELAYALDVGLPEAGEAAARLVAAGVVVGSGNGFYRAHPAELRLVWQHLARRVIPQMVLERPLWKIRR